MPPMRSATYQPCWHHAASSAHTLSSDDIEKAPVGGGAGDETLALASLNYA
jgi:hypothetical protein